MIPLLAALLGIKPRQLRYLLLKSDGRPANTSKFSGLFIKSKNVLDLLHPSPRLPVSPLIYATLMEASNGKDPSNNRTQVRIHPSRRDVVQTLLLQILIKALELSSVPFLCSLLRAIKILEHGLIACSEEVGR